jgi:hypothetical protein
LNREFIVDDQCGEMCESMRRHEIAASLRHQRFGSPEADIVMACIEPQLTARNR